MSIVKKFNGLNGCEVTRKAIEKMHREAIEQEQPELAERLSAVLAAYPKEPKVKFHIPEPATERVPASLLGAFQEDDINEKAGLGKVSQQDIYDKVTELIINTIKEVGHLPWQKEWTGTGAEGAAMNYVSKKPYTGINFLTLNFDVAFTPHGKPYLVPATFIQPYYLTFKQIEAAGATLKKGSKARNVFYYSMIFVYKNGELSIKTADRQKFSAFVAKHGITPEDLRKYGGKIPVIKYYNVYRADDCTGLKFPEKKKPAVKAEPIEIAQAIIDNYPNPPKFTFGGDDAVYFPLADIVNMPTLESFNRPADYYCTYFHEITHSTGHSKRLDRGLDGKSMDKKQSYAFEELVAELGAVYLCSEAGTLFSTKDNSAKYLAGWSKRLIKEMKDDNRFFFKAAAAAQKATNHILDRDADDVPAYIRNKPKQDKEKKVPVKKTKTVKTSKSGKMVGYALVDNISGEVVASKLTLDELRSVYNDLRKEKYKGLEALVYEIISVAGKNKLGQKVEVDFNRDIEVKPGTQLALLGARKKRKNGLNGVQAEPQAMPSGDESSTESSALNCPVPDIQKVQEPETVPAPMASKNPKVQRIGANIDATPSQYYTVGGEVGKFLQQVEKKPVHSVVITMDGEQGAGKTTTLYHFMDAFAKPGNKCLFISGEEHPSSSLATTKVAKYLSHDAQDNIDTVAEVDNAQELYELVADYDIIFIDSWQKLLRMIGNLHLDEDLRKRFDGKVFVIIFQQTTTGRTKGGAEVVFDGDIIIKMVKEASFSNNYAYFDKNRYTLVPLETIRYNIASASTYDPTEAAEQEEAVTESLPAELSKLKFKIQA